MTSLVIEFADVNQGCRFRLINPTSPRQGLPMGSWFCFPVPVMRARRRILQQRWVKARYAKLEQSQAFAYHSSLQPEAGRSDDSTVLTSVDMMPPLPVPPPEPVVVHRQVAIRG